MNIWDFSHSSDDVRIRVCEHLWPVDWSCRCASLCRNAHDFVKRRDVRVGLFRLLPKSAYALTSPLWQLLKVAIRFGASPFLEAAFEAMGSPAKERHLAVDASVANFSVGGDANDGYHQSRILGRCLNLAVLHGSSEIVALALRCRADVEQRINGQSALDCAAQLGRLAHVELLLVAGAQPSQTAPMRWTPLMRAALGNHADTCVRLLEAAAAPNEWSDKSTALDIAEVNNHHHVVAKLRSRGAQRFLELRASATSKSAPSSGRSASSQLQAAEGRSQSASARPSSARLRPGPHSQGGGLPRGVLAGSAVLCLKHLREDAETSDSDEQ